MDLKQPHTIYRNANTSFRYDIVPGIVQHDIGDRITINDRDYIVIGQQEEFNNIVYLLKLPTDE